MDGCLLGCAGRKYNNRRCCVSRFIFGSVDAAGQLCNAGHLFIRTEGSIPRCFASGYVDCRKANEINMRMT